ncbi:sensor domain CHASE-containing protein [Rhizobium sp. PP-F2F-G48]|uniref:sensor histidine kinase n=1 Tax=Rhizobium sp. PP-F2F-G48 TaxID=2135651 RepID=UPI00104A3A1E|nr:CHASE4 domain-containing protein [Rhizobium sp. PP-F2F-G48]TCM52753.1 sensor domain CHASE-containing protein [Rhizobium sp. PP-F2F-G48]
MRLVTKLNVALLGVVAVSAVLNFATLRLAVLPSFSALEEQAAERNQTRVLEAIQLQKDQVANSAGDYAIWDDTYDFMKGAGPDYQDKNVTADSLKTLGVTFFVAIDTAGQVVLDSGFAQDDADEPRPVKLLPTTRLPQNSPFLTEPQGLAIRSSLMQTPEGLAVIGYSPILRSDRSGIRAGTLVLGRLLDMDAIRSATRVDFDLVATSSFPTRPMSESGRTVDKIDPLLGPDGRALAMIRSHTPRDITAVGEQTILTTLLLLLAGATILLIALGVILRLIVIRRIETLRSHLLSVAASGHLDPMREDGKGDELSETVVSFNAMARQLDDLRAKLRRQDYDHGAADEAAGLLHNVRNALSPISVVAWGLAKANAAPWKQNLTKALDQLGEDGLAPDRAAKLQQFVALSSARLMDEDRARQEEVGSLVSMLRHVDDILKDQDRSAQRERVLDTVDLAASLRNALPLIERRDGIAVDVGDLESLAALGHRVPLEQVFGNLIVNAAEAIDASGKGAGTVRIAARSITDGAGTGSVELTVSDDGVGIDAANRDRLFEKGFSTKSGGKRGVGLHWCANAVNAMGGRLSVESDGPQQGATFRITLPAALSRRDAA